MEEKLHKSIILEWNPSVFFFHDFFGELLSLFRSYPLLSHSGVSGCRLLEFCRAFNNALLRVAILNRKCFAWSVLLDTVDVVVLEGLYQRSTSHTIFITEIKNNDSRNELFLSNKKLWCETGCPASWMYKHSYVMVRRWIFVIIYPTESF